MINTNEIDSSRKCFKYSNQDLILLDDEDNDHQTLRNIITAATKIIPNEDRSFLMFDFGSITSQYIKMKKLIPRAYPFFAIKCMADKQIISLLGSLGTGFDCASLDEIYNGSLALPKPPGTFPEKNHPLNTEKIIFSHPFKFPQEMVNANKIGVEFTVFDTEEELKSISKYWPQAKLLLRILPPRAFEALSELGKKFGVEKNEMKHLIMLAKELRMHLVGVCFHVGSGVREMDSWSQCIEYSAQVFRMMEKHGFKPYLLDIGGGFPAMSMINSEKNHEMQIEFEKECQSINFILDKYFPASENYVIISEPGNYFTGGSACLFCQVIGKIEEDPTIEQKTINNQIYPKVKYSYILNNSSYHTIEYGSQFEIYSVKEFIRRGQLINYRKDFPDEEKIKSRFLGLTVDEFDTLVREIEIPELFVNDWLVLVDKGAYSDVHNELPTMFCAATTIPHYYSISKSSLAVLQSRIKNGSTRDYKVLNSTNRYDALETITNKCSVM